MRIGDLESILAAQRVGEADEISGAIHTAWGRFSPEWATSRADRDGNEKSWPCARSFAPFGDS
jgi:hypothetical protein